MSTRNKRACGTVIGGLAVLALFAQFLIAASSSGHPPGQEQSLHPLPAPPKRTPAERIASLPCFQCHEHSLETFLAEPDREKMQEEKTKKREDRTFYHSIHMEMIGHCHLCHTFQGHFEQVIRKSTCTNCHEE